MFEDEEESEARCVVYMLGSDYMYIEDEHYVEFIVEEDVDG